jgi:hypothetical protein
VLLPHARQCARRTTPSGAVSPTRNSATRPSQCGLAATTRCSSSRSAPIGAPHAAVSRTSPIAVSPECDQFSNGVVMNHVHGRMRLVSFQTSTTT